MDLISMISEIVYVSIAIAVVVMVVHAISGGFKKQPQNLGQNPTQIQSKNKIWYSLWFWWILTTVIYLVFNFSGYPGNKTSLIGHIAGFVGLFVPYGWLSSILLVISPFSWISVVVFLILMSMTEKDLNKKNYSLGKRILINLLVLLLLTFAVDCVRGTFFMSWNIFLKGAFMAQ